EPGSGMAVSTNRTIEDNDMNDVEITENSTAAMLTQVETTIDNVEPIAFNAWRPHPMFVRCDIKFVEDPRVTCNLDDIELLTTHEFAEESQTENTLYSNMNLSIDMVEKWLVSMDEGKEPRVLAEIWVEENQDIVNEWLDK